MMMTTEKAQSEIEALRNDFDAMLSRHKFKPCPDGVVADQMMDYRWSQDADWKRETVRLIFPTEYLKENGYVLVQVELHLPSGAEGGFECFDGTSVDFIVGDDVASYSFPALGGIFPRRFTRWRRSIVLKTEKALSWFGNFSTPDLCLARLKTEETNLGTIKEHGAARRALQYLERLDKTD